VQDKAALVLEDGTVLHGNAYGALGTTLGELVFNTAMTGYQESLTDPSYHSQILIFTAPHIGNTGVNYEDPESNKIWVAGVVLRDPARRVSSWRAEKSLETDLEEQKIVGISGVDTRFLVRHLRDKGVMRAGIFSGAALVTEQEMLSQVREAPLMAGSELAGQVTTGKTYTVEPSGDFAGLDPLATVVAIDLGIKSMTPERLAERGVRTHVVPKDTTFAQIIDLLPDDAPGGVFFSNGPGDPETMTGTVALLKDVLDAKIPFFGICFGHQMFGRALGFDTYKLPFGHRGVNQPVMDRTTDKVEITAHNHGFAVAAPLEAATEQTAVLAPNNQYGRVMVSHVGLNDNVVEGLQALDIPAFSVQYHPEAAAGPHDSAYLFDRFLNLMQNNSSHPTIPKT
jgi:carbamoyl-phosphate synthase small subunit